MNSCAEETFVQESKKFRNSWYGQPKEKADRRGLGVRIQTPLWLTDKKLKADYREMFLGQAEC